MTPTQLDDADLDLGCHLMGAAIGLGAVVKQGAKTLAGVAQQPAVKGPSVDAVAGGGVSDGGTLASTSRTAS